MRWLFTGVLKKLIFFEDSFLNRHLMETLGELLQLIFKVNHHPLKVKVNNFANFG